MSGIVWIFNVFKGYSLAWFHHGERRSSLFWRLNGVMRLRLSVKDMKSFWKQDFKQSCRHMFRWELAGHSIPSQKLQKDTCWNEVLLNMNMCALLSLLAIIKAIFIFSLGLSNNAFQCDANHWRFVISNQPWQSGSWNNFMALSHQRDCFANPDDIGSDSSVSFLHGHHFDKSLGSYRHPQHTSLDSRPSLNRLLAHVWIWCQINQNLQIRLDQGVISIHYWETKIGSFFKHDCDH